MRWIPCNFSNTVFHILQVRVDWWSTRTMYRFAAEWLVFKEKFRNGQTFLKDSIDGNWKGRRRSNFALRKKSIEEHIHLKCHKMSTLRNLRTFFKTCIDLPYSETDCIYNCKVSTFIVLVDGFFIEFHLANVCILYHYKWVCNPFDFS